MEQMEEETWADRWSAAVRGNIATARRERELSARELSELCGKLGYPIARSTIAGIEAGVRRHVSTHELVVLAQALGVPPVRLLFDVHEATQAEVLPGVEVLPVEAAEWFSGHLRLDDNGRPTDENSEAVDHELYLARLERRHQAYATHWVARVDRVREHLRALEAGAPVDEHSGELPATLAETRQQLEGDERIVRGAVHSLQEVRAQMREQGMALPPLRESIREAYEAAGGDA